jgi:hypothetical protein
MAAANPMSEKNIFSAKALYVDAAINVLDQKRIELVNQGKDPGDRQLLALTNAKQVLVNRKAQFAQLDSDATVQGKLKDFMGEKKPTLSAKRLLDKVMKGVDLRAGGQPALPTHHKGIREQAILERFLGRAFKQAGVEPPNLKHALHDAHIEVLNAQSWDTIAKDVRFSHQGKDVKFTSRIDPQGQLGDKYGDPATGMKGGGINCHCSKEHKQAVNVAATELRDAGGGLLMRGVRHGVNCAYGISTKELKHASSKELRELAQALLPQGDWVQTGGAPDLDATVAKMRKSEGFRRECADTMRAAANMNRAKDVVTSALVMDPAKLRQAIADAQNGVSPPTVQLDISSISLMTPDLGRSWKSGNAMAKDNERRMVPEQIEAWNRLTAGSPVTLKVADPATHGGLDGASRSTVYVLPCHFGVTRAR